ncbi:MAG: hypothetical protein L0211_23595 [Planctomycetaceae bacterium]|nr:hypothetical protein [Planctomycetaceae bacterium]
MFRSLSKSIRKPVLWLMLPLAVLAGRPTAGCICVDGSVKTACCQSDWFLASLRSNSAEGSDCCAGRDAPTCPHCCSPAGNGSRTDNSTSGCSSLGGCRCSALANNVQPTKITDWSQTDGFTHAPASSVEIPVQAQVLTASFQNVPGDVPHPPDMVVLYQRLTI